MKRIVLPLIFILMFSACASETEIAEPDFVLNTEMCIRYAGSEYKAQASTDNSGELKIKVTEPDTIDGISVVCSENGTEITCGELSVKSEKGFYVFTKLYKTLNNAKNSEPISKENAGETNIFKYNGFSIETDVSTNRIKKIVTSDCIYEMR